MNRFNHLCLVAALLITAAPVHAALKVDRTIVDATIQKPGLRISYALPVDCTATDPTTTDCVMTAITDTNDTETPKRDLYYTIGGVRLKFDFDPKSLTKEQQAASPVYEWTFGRDGRSCPSFKQKKDDSNCASIKANTPIKDKTTLWWEPNNWDSPSSTDGVLTITYTEPDKNPETKIRFKLESRTLQAKAGDPMKGSDVKMLEQMLWQLGMSPGTKKGTAGARLEKAKQDKFLTTNPSIGQMVGRFNYSNFGYVSKGIVHGVASITTEMQTGTVSGESVTKKLGQHWIHYLMAYQQHTATSQYQYSNLSDTDINNAVAIFDGGHFGYSDTYATYTGTFTIEKTYTADKHKDMTQYKSDFKRSDILKAMASRESSGIHWGQGSHAHRISVGSGDELGSKGFNQIQNAYSHGARSGMGNLRGGSYCGAVTAYTTTGKSYANHYDPAENIKAKAMFLTYGQGDCNRGFYLAYFRNSYTAPLDKKGITLKAMKTGSKTEIINGAHTDDTYEVLAKALGAYNQGHSVFNKKDSWAELLIEQSHSGTGKTATAMNYALDILHTPSRGIGLPRRQYIWQGGTYAVDLKDADGNLDPKAGQAWCFGYGESEWLSGTLFKNVRDNAIGSLDKAPTGRIDCATGLSI